MSDIQKIMKFELLPNEILIECFEYFNAFEIFHSFDQLNNRFNQLIRNIRLYLNFQNVRKSIFDQFCSKMILNPQIKNQIHSLYLSKEVDCGQIEMFLSLLSINKFPHLRSLTLIDLTHDYEGILQSALPLLSGVCSLQILGPPFMKKGSLDALPMGKLQILSLSSVQPLLTLNNKTSLINSLTISRCSVIDLIDVLKSMPRLIYLRIRTVSQPLQSTNKISHPNDHYAVCLKQLILLQFESDFEELKLLLKHTPNIRSLTIFGDGDETIIDASGWEELIKSSLPHLNNFKFQFDYYYGDEGSTDDEEIINYEQIMIIDDEGRSDGEVSTIVKKFKGFQTSFWYEEHHWYTEYILNNDFALIYTVPYMLKKYELNPTAKRYYGELTNNLNTFANVTDLTFQYILINEKCDYKFSNVTSLTISGWYLTTEHMAPLKAIVNLFNLKHLGMSERGKIESSSVLLEILKEAPQLSSMTIDPDLLICLCAENDELGNYLNKMIKKLHVDRLANYPSDRFSLSLQDFCRIFSNLEQLIYITDERDESDILLYLLKHLSKLFRLNIYMRILDRRGWRFSRFKNEAKKRNIIYRIEKYYTNDFNNGESLRIWSG